MNPEAQRSFELPSYIRFTGRWLSKISPALATRFALKLFFKPLRFPIPKRELALRQKAKRHRLQLEDGRSFKVFELPAKGPKVLLIHGWSGRASQFFKLMDALHAQGFHCLGIEAPGHGDNLGESTHMLAFVSSISKTLERWPNIPYAIGHSLGGMAIFNAFKEGADFQKVSIIGSPASIQNVVSDFCERLELSLKVRDGILNYIEKRYQLKTSDASTDYLAKKFNPEGLIIHDEDDRDVPVLNGHQSKAAWKKAKLYLTKGKGHRKVLMDEAVIEEILTFLQI